MFKSMNPEKMEMRGVERSGWWNCDSPYVTALLAGTILPVEISAGATVWSVGRDYHGRSRAAVDEDGTFAVKAQFRSHVGIEVAPKPSPNILAKLRDGNTPSHELCQIESNLKTYKIESFFETRAPGSITEVGNITLSN